MPGRFVNADVIARSLNVDSPEAASLAAGRETLREIARLIEARESFAYETTLSSRQSVELMRTARDLGFEVGLVFIALRSADLHVERVAQRVREGGHNIAEATIRRRYDVALDKLPTAMEYASGTAIYDNSDTVPQLVLRVRDGRIETNALCAARNFHLRLAAAVGRALSMSPNEVLRAAR